MKRRLLLILLLSHVLASYTAYLIGFAAHSLLPPNAGLMNALPDGDAFLLAPLTVPDLLNRLYEKAAPLGYTRNEFILCARLAYALPLFIFFRLLNFWLPRPAGERRPRLNLRQLSFATAALFSFLVFLTLYNVPGQLPPFADAIGILETRSDVRDGQEVVTFQDSGLLWHNGLLWYQDWRQWCPASDQAGADFIRTLAPPRPTLTHRPVTPPSLTRVRAKPSAFLFVQWARSENGNRLEGTSLFAACCPEWIILVLFLALPTCWLFVRARSHYLSRRTRHRTAHNLCLACGYNLTGNTTGVCPECGSLPSKSVPA